MQDQNAWVENLELENKGAVMVIGHCKFFLVAWAQCSSNF